MSHLIAIFLLGFKRFFNKRNLIMFLVVFILLLYGVNKGVDKYRDMLDKSKEFQKIEEQMFSSSILSYTVYSFLGVRYLFVPSASSIFFTEPPMMSELAAKIDSVANVKIYNNCKGSVVFKNNRGFLRFSRLLILLGTLFSLFTGNELMFRKEYLKFLCSNFSRLKIFLSVIFSRFILIAFTFMVLFMCMVGVVRLWGIELTSSDYNGLWVYLGITLLILMIFLIIGGIIGTIRANSINIILLLGVWIVSVFIIPGIFDSIIEDRSYNIVSSYKSDLKKLQMMANFEKKVEAKYGKFDRKNIVAEREIVEDHWKNDYPEIEKVEKSLNQEVSVVIDQYQDLSIMFPTTFYNLTALEVSSRGYENYLEFYHKGQENQKKFARFWMDRVFYNDPTQMVSFVKGDENIFRGISRIPGNFISGLLVHLFYIVVLLYGGYIRFKKWLDTPIDKRTFNEKDRNIHLKKGQVNVLYSHRPALREQLYLLLAGRDIKKIASVPCLNVILEGERFTEPSAKDRFVYICHPSTIPGDIKSVDLISFIVRTNGVSVTEKESIFRSLPGDFIVNKRFDRLEPPEQADILLTLVPYIKGNIYLVDQIGKDMPLSILVKLKDQLETLAKKGAIVIYLTPEKRVEALPIQPEREVLDLPDWFEAVEAHRFLLDEETGKWRTLVRSDT